MTDEQSITEATEAPQFAEAGSVQPDAPLARRAKVGRVVTAGHGKTCAVQVDRLTKHPMYNKYVKRSTKLLVHDERDEAQLGDTVEIVPCRRISKRKAHRLVKILRRAEAK